MFRGWYVSTCQPRFALGAAKVRYLDCCSPLQLSDPQPAVDQLFLHCSIRKRLTIIVWQQAACTESGSRLPQSKTIGAKKRLEPSADNSNLSINQKLTDRLPVINLDVAIAFNLNFHAAVTTEVTVATIVTGNRVGRWSDGSRCSVVSSKW